MSAAATPESKFHSDADRVDGLKEHQTLTEALGAFASRTGPRLMFAACAIALAAKLYVANFQLLDLAVVAGVVVFWWLMEWAAHITVLHMKPRKILGFDYDPIYARFHRAHHREPWSPDWVLVPVRFIVLGFFVSGLVFWAVLPTLSLAATAWLAFCVMGVLYEWSHLLVHTRYKPKSKFFREIWRNHRLHHFKNESYWFGLSGTLADTVLGTAPDHTKVETSDTVRTLGVDDETGEN